MKKLKIGIEGNNKASVNTVHVSTSKLETKPNISSAHCTKLVFPGTIIQIVRVQAKKLKIRIEKRRHV